MQNCEPLITNVHARKRTSLNGPWSAIPDQYDAGYLTNLSELHPYGFYTIRKQKPGVKPVEFNYDKSPKLKVPGDWNSQRPELLFYEGTVWYQRYFNYRKKKNTRLYLHFDAVYYNAVVFINGKIAGEHTGGFTPFNFDITALVRNGKNFIIVKVNNTRLRHGVPMRNTDWWNYGGITRDVNLVEIPDTFIQDYRIQLKPGSDNIIAGWIKMNRKKAGQTVTLSIPGAGIDLKAKTNAQGLARFQVRACLTLWTPERPKLYNVMIKAAKERLQDKIGFRTISVSGTDILLNGKSIFLKGVSIHEEVPIGPGRAHSPAHAKKLLGWAKEMGCNFVRLAHYPHNEHMVRAADKMGLMVWAEIPVYWTIDWKNKETYANARAQLTEIITRDKNRACVVLWSVANETPISKRRQTFLSGLVKTAKRLDPGRPVTAALNTYRAGASRVDIDDPLGKVIDVIGCNQYFGWYDGRPHSETDKKRWRNPLNKPLIMSEFGGGALGGRYGSRSEIWTEEFQESIYKHQVAMFKKIPFLRGTSPWILKDFRSPRRVYATVQDLYNRKGLISDKGKKKKAFYVMKKFYKEL
jgi:beta-glucuronidase